MDQVFDENHKIKGNATLKQKKDLLTKLNKLEGNQFSGQSKALEKSIKIEQNQIFNDFINSIEENVTLSNDLVNQYQLLKSMPGFNHDTFILELKPKGNDEKALRNWTKLGLLGNL
ncbi:hypothetical protein DID75_04390 [Candidatus Marinamargulisbacteria bacterium SCGC AG-410-N11]|nr:hypothetical protein DID75_04390 [Candidatus Marinamargulisbacteria bacterium SCGC AG-410-N11]